jgi:hypothetical protein
MVATDSEDIDVILKRGSLAGELDGVFEGWLSRRKVEA